MKALVLEAANRLALREVEEPVPATGEEVISVSIAGLGGSETLALANPGIRPLPNIMGHGFAGTTSDGRRVAVNPLVSCDDCKYCHRDQRHLCDQWTLIGVQRNGGFAERVAVPTSSLVEIPEDMSWAQASFIEPFANSVGGWEKVFPASDASVLIIGAGGLGLGLVACANADDRERPVEVLEPSENRMKAVVDLGGVSCVDGETRRFDVVFDTVGSAGSRFLALRLADKGATIVALGFKAAVQEIPVNELIRHEHKMIGSFVYTADQFRTSLALAAQMNDQYVTELGWPEVHDALIKFQKGEFSIVKAALRPGRVSC